MKGLATTQEAGWQTKHQTATKRRADSYREIQEIRVADRKATGTSSVRRSLRTCRLTGKSTAHLSSRLCAPSAHKIT